MQTSIVLFQSFQGTQSSGPISILHQNLWDLFWTKRYTDCFISKQSRLPLSISFQQYCILIFHHLTETLYNLLNRKLLKTLLAHIILQRRGLQTFYGKGPQRRLWARSQAALGQITVSSISTQLPKLLCNSYSTYIIYKCDCGPCDKSQQAAVWIPMF